MPFTLDRPRAAVACLHLATYMRAAKLAGQASVVDTDAGYCLGVALKRLSPEELEQVPPVVDGLTVKVLI